MSRRITFLGLAGALLLPVAGITAQALPIGSSARGTTTSETPAMFRYTAASAGVLTVVATSGSDISLAIADEDGQGVPYGNADIDHGGNVGNEFVTVILPEAGIYLVEVRTWDDDPAAFEVSASFIANASFGGQPDPDRRPSRANELKVGDSRNDTVNADEGDNWDWFVIKASFTGTLVVMTRVAGEDSGDLAIEAYLGNDYREPVMRSDQDLQGVLGNESVTVDVKEGDELRIKVEQLGSGAAVPYRISVGRVP